MKKERIMASIIVYSVVILIYISFLAYPVEPAQAEAASYHLVETKELKNFPSSMYKVYVRESTTPAILVVSTVRSPYVPVSTYSKSLKYTEKIAEDEVRDRYGVEINLVYRGERVANIGNHTVVMDEYDVYLEESSWFTPKVLKMDVGAFFCQENFQSVIVVYVYPPLYESDFDSVMASIRC